MSVEIEEVAEVVQVKCDEYSSQVGLKPSYTHEL